MHHEEFMQLTINEAQKAGTPFAASIAMGNDVLVTKVQSASPDHDPTAHAIVLALRELGKLTHQTDFSGYTLYSTCEPCMMCGGAALWSHIGEIYFGVPRTWITQHYKNNDPGCSKVLQKSAKQITIHSEFMFKKCIQLFE